MNDSTRRYGLCRYSETCFDMLLKEINIFSELKKTGDPVKDEWKPSPNGDWGIFGSILKHAHDEKYWKEETEKKKTEKILMRKIQNDILYYSVMGNFRRGLQNATITWIKADESLKEAERNKVKEDKNRVDIGGTDLKNEVAKVITELVNKIGNKIENKIENNIIKTSDPSNYTDSNNENSDLTDDEKKELKKIRDTVQKIMDEKEEKESDFGKKIELIEDKLNNRDKWETPEWRAMGSIYYKWREDGFKDKDDGKEQADKTISEKWKKWMDERKGITKEPELDPTEVAWEKNRTIRAVDSLSKSFGFDHSGGTGKAIVFFGVVFALIISTALLNSLDIVIEAIQLPEDCDDCWHTDWDFLKINFEEFQYVIMLLLCFFPLGILFYHQGVIFLSANAAEELTLGNKPLIFVNFIFILLQAIVVYFLASSIGDVNAFLSLVMVLVFFDAIWVLVFTWNDMRDSVRDAPVYLEWIIFDIIIGLFVWVFAMNYASTGDTYAEGWSQNFLIFFLLLVAFTTRSIVDYTYGWKNFWSKFADAE